MTDKNKPDSGENREIDYDLEGGNPPKSKKKNDPTDAGYDEAARSGDSRYGRPEGQGGVFGTTGGGTYPGGMHEEPHRPERADKDEVRKPKK